LLCVRLIENRFTLFRARFGGMLAGSPTNRRSRHPGKAEPYPGSLQIEELAFLRSRLALRLAGMTIR
jgi:hypothetical protein